MRGLHLRAQRRDRLCLLFIFLASAALHAVFCDYPKQMAIYRDEYLYFEIGKSIWAGQGIHIQINGMAVDFQKIGYSLFLAPFFAVPQTALRLRLISLGNCALTASSVFPVWLIGKELGLRRRWRYIAVLAVCAAPESLIATTLMAENLYYPLVLWSVWLWLLQGRNARWQTALLHGAVGFLAYLTKEAYLALAASFLLLDLVRLIRVSRERRKPDTRLLACMAAYLLVFAALAAAARFTLFAHEDYSYGPQLRTSAQTWLSRLEYLGFGVLYHFAATLCAVCVLPVILPLANRRRMSERQRRFGSMILLYTVISVVFIAYAITVPEEYGEPIPRFHLRYYAPALILMFINMTAAVQQGPGPEKNALFRRYILFAACAMALILLCFPGSRNGTAVDQFNLAWYDEIYWNRLFYDSALAPDHSLGTWLLFLIMALTLLIAGVLIRRKRLRGTAAFFGCVMLALTVYNWIVLIPKLQRNYLADPEQISQIETVNESLAELSPDQSVLLLSDGEYSDTKRLLDAYLDLPGRVIVSYTHEVSWTEDGRRLDTGGADYCIVADRSLSDTFDFADCETAVPESVTLVQVYSCPDPRGLLLLPAGIESLSRSQPLEIWFYGDRCNASDYAEGISYPEETFTWSEGPQIRLEVPMADGSSRVAAELEIAGVFAEAQTVSVTCGDEEVLYIVAEEEDTFVFELTPVSGVLSFTIDLPDAQAVNHVDPDSQDSRVVAIQLRRLTLTVLPDEPPED